MYLAMLRVVCFDQALKESRMDTVTNNDEPYMKPSTRFRKLISQDGVCIQAPGVYDGICARLAIEQGFQVMVSEQAPLMNQNKVAHLIDLRLQYQSGSMTTAARLGRVDLGGRRIIKKKKNAQMIANIDPRVPLIADADTGFGSPPNIARMVQMYDQCGVAGFHIEDQVTNKRCGHLKGKEVVDMELVPSKHVELT